MDVPVLDVKGYPGVGVEDLVVGAFDAVVLGCAAVAAEEVPPEASADLGLEGGQAQAVAVTVDAEGLGEADDEAVQDPEAFASVVDAEDGLGWVVLG